MSENYMEEVPVCVLCGSKEFKTFFKIPVKIFLPETCRPISIIGRKHPETFIVVKCKKCGLVRNNPRLNEEETFASYNPEMFEGRIGFLQAKRILIKWFGKGIKSREELVQKVLRGEGSEAAWNKELERIEKHMTKGKILDVGCANGFFIKVAKSRGWNEFGVEPSKVAFKNAQKFGLTVKNCTLQEAKFKEKEFDVVTMFDVIEHLRNPIEVLNECNRITKKGGLIVIKTPDIDALNAKFAGKYWDQVGPAGHLHYFSRKTLEKAMNKCGFEKVEFWTSNSGFTAFRGFCFELLDNFIKLLLIKMHTSKGFGKKIGKMLAKKGFIVEENEMTQRLKMIYPPRWPTFGDFQCAIFRKTKEL